jgi:crossover junction endodeoxyribonuclease RuvC
MRILGIDPGYDRLGIAIIEKGQKDEVIYSECFETSSKEVFLERLRKIGTRVKDIIEKYSPEIMAIESLFIAKNQKTAMRVSEARGVIIYEAICKNLLVYEYTPLQVKMAITSNGRSDKTSVMKMLPLLIKLPKKSTKDDEYDAIAIALTCIAYDIKSFPQIK